MDAALWAMIFSAGAVTLAEMGDKTQLLAMAFATKFSAPKVLIGVFLATVLNHAMAVALGNYITNFVSLQIWIQGIAALSFIFFGLWTIRGDQLEGEENRISKFGPIATVAIAFFIAEMGDKTQLTTIALATRFPLEPLGILLGTTTGMLIADGIGIWVGVVMCKRIPERTIKIISAAVFVFFGFLASYQVGVNQMGLAIPVVLAILLVLALLTAWAAWQLIMADKKDRKLPAKAA